MKQVRFILFVALLFSAGEKIFAQEDSYEDLFSAFQEEDLYVNSPYRPGRPATEDDNSYAASTIRLNLGDYLLPNGILPDRQTMDAPPPPDPPDVSINRAMFFLLLSGLFYGIKKLKE